LRGFCICGFCTLRKMDNVVYLYTYTSARTVSLQKTICTTLRYPFCAVCKIHKRKIHAKSTSTTHCRRRFALLYQSTCRTQFALRYPFCALCKIHKCKIHAKSTSTTHCRKRFALLYQSTSYFLPCIHISKQNSRAARTTTKFLAAPVALFCASELSN